jgi:acetyl esterase/lipase
MSRNRIVSVLLVALAFLLGGCTSAKEWLGIRLFYDEVRLPAERVMEDLPYREGSDDPKHRLDLFLPAGEGWPTVVFVHGGGWTAGDKGLVVSGGDVYGNFGRFLASHGIGAAVISYRLQPAVTWREQVADVAHAAAWVYAHVGEHGGDPEALFLSGHSAGAQLSTYVALAPEPLEAVGLSPEALCGAIPVSGAGYDLADEETYEMGAERSYYEERFRAGDPGDGWLREASAMTYLTAAAPPFLLLHGTREWKSLQHQNRLLDQALRDAGASSRLVPVKGQSHGRIVLALSKDDTIPGSEILAFVRGTDCEPATP